MDLENHFLVPREDFYEMQQAAAVPPTLNERALNTAQGLTVLAGFAVAVVSSVAGCCAVAEYFERKSDERLERKQARKLNAVK